MPTIKNTTDAFVAKIQALYDVETQLVKALSKLEKAATNSELKTGFRTHRAETMVHGTRLERIFALLDMKPKKLKSEAIRGIMDDAEWVIAKGPANGALKDAMIAAAARYAEHYEMAGYLSAIAEANALGMTDAVELLSKTLDEEMATDEKLSNALTENLDAAS